MPTPRKHLIIAGQPGFYHCISRCVRRTWLCGIDPQSRRNYNHRRDWMIARMRLLTTCFAIDVYAYSFMSNHYHIVLHVDPERIKTWSDEQVIHKWRLIWTWRNPDKPPIIPNHVPETVVREWRSRLADISWFMRVLNEPIARLSNAEEDKTGHFWESRFHSTALLDDAALLACMAYVDLNPIKGGVARCIEESDFTSIKERLLELKESDSRSNRFARKDREPDLGAVASGNQLGSPRIRVSLRCYVELIESTASQILSAAAFKPPVSLPLNLNPASWQLAVTALLDLFRSAAGSESAFDSYMIETGRCRRQRTHARRQIFG